MVNILLSRSYIDNPWLYIYFKKYIKKGMRVLVIPWSFYPDYDYDNYRPGGDYYNRLVNQFIPYDIEEKDIHWLDYYEDNHDDMVKQIKKADLIYLTGGLPDKLFERLNEHNLAESLEKFDGVMVGISAGAVVQFKTYHLSPDQDYKKFDIYPGLDLIHDFGVDVHYDKKFKQKRSIKKMSKIIDRPYYTIPDAGALINDNGRVILINGSKEFYIKK